MLAAAERKLPGMRILCTFKGRHHRNIVGFYSAVVQRVVTEGRGSKRHVVELKCKGHGDRRVTLTPAEFCSSAPDHGVVLGEKKKRIVPVLTWLAKFAAKMPPVSVDEEVALGKILAPEPVVVPDPVKVPRAPRVPKAQAASKMGALEAAFIVLKAAGRPMRHVEILAAVREQGLWDSDSKWAAESIRAVITRDIDGDTVSRFTKPGPNLFALRGGA